MSASTGPDEREAIEARLAEIERSQKSASATPLIWSTAHPGDSTLSNEAYGLIQHDVPWLLSALRAARRELDELKEKYADAGKHISLQVERAERASKDAARYQFLRDNPLGLRAIDGNASPRSFTGQGFDHFTDIAMEQAANVPNIEEGGCDVCDDPKCYRNQPVEDAPASVPPILERNDRG